MATSSTELVSYIEDMIYDLPSDVKQKLTRKMTAIKSLTHNNPENSRKLIEERYEIRHLVCNLPLNVCACFSDFE